MIPVKDFRRRRRREIGLFGVSRARARCIIEKSNQRAPSRAQSNPLMHFWAAKRSQRRRRRLGPEMSARARAIISIMIAMARADLTCATVENVGHFALGAVALGARLWPTRPSWAARKGKGNVNNWSERADEREVGSRGRICYEAQGCVTLIDSAQASS